MPEYVEGLNPVHIGAKTPNPERSMPETKCRNIFSGNVPSEFLPIIFQKKYKLTNIFFYSSEFVWALPVFPVQLAKMVHGLLLAARDLQAPICTIELHVVNDGQMAFFNSSFMKCPGPTNILSFPGGGNMPGSLVLSLPAFIRESRLYGQESLEYLFHLLTHGLGHLAGFEHGTEMEEFMAMLKRRQSAASGLWERGSEKGSAYE